MELRDYLNVIRARRRIIILTTLVVGAVALLVSLAQPKEFHSQAVVLIAESDSGAAVFGSLVPELSSQPERGLQTQVQLMQMRPLAEAVARKIGLEESPDDLLRSIHVAAEGETNIVVVTASDDNPEQAAVIANAMADEYVIWSRDTRRESLQAAADEVEIRLDEAKDQIFELADQVQDDEQTADFAAELQIATAAYSTLAEKLEQLRIEQQLETGSGRIVSPAVAVLEPVAPTPVRDTALGLAVGLALGLGLAFALEYMDDSLKSAQDTERAYGAPVLGTIPADTALDGEQRVAMLSSPSSSAAEAYRVLRNSLDFVNFDESVKTILITSAVPGEGKSTVASNLAASLAQAGTKVVLVSADFRRPTTNQHFGVSNMIGLSDVLMGAHSLKAALQRPWDESLLVLPSGKEPPNPAELLGSSKMGGLLDELREWADWIIVDTPPLLAVADPASVARWCDGVLPVSKAGESTKYAAQKAVELLNNVGARIIGVVIWGVPGGRAGDGYTRYAGGYSYRYYLDDTSKHEASSAGAKDSVVITPPNESAGRRVARVVLGVLAFLAVVVLAALVAYLLDAYLGLGLLDTIIP